MQQNNSTQNLILLYIPLYSRSKQFCRYYNTYASTYCFISIVPYSSSTTKRRLPINNYYLIILVKYIYALAYHFIKQLIKYSWI